MPEASVFYSFSSSLFFSPSSHSSFGMWGFVIWERRRWRVEQALSPALRPPTEPLARLGPSGDDPSFTSSAPASLRQGNGATGQRRRNAPSERLEINAPKTCLRSYVAPARLFRVGRRPPTLRSFVAPCSRRGERALKKGKAGGGAARWRYHNI